jgi:hypothetical protein
MVLDIASSVSDDTGMKQQNQGGKRQRGGGKGRGGRGGKANQSQGQNRGLGSNYPHTSWQNTVSNALQFNLFWKNLQNLSKITWIMLCQYSDPPRNAPKRQFIFHK